MLYLIRFGVVCAVLKLSAGQNCESKDTCDKCIQEPNCFWCSSVKAGTSHCRMMEEINSCEQDYIENPLNNYLVLESRQLADSEQIKPQKVKLKLRKNEKYSLKFQYRQSANYPVDLYYIMDHSNSMLPSKDRLAVLGGDLVEEMKRKTNDFRIGFGSFVDKLTLPFVNTDPNALKNPCKQYSCAPPYSFKNHLSLIPDSKLFSQQVRNTHVSGNLDTPEGGLDAIMQAMVCKKEIGWRPNARHLLVMSTDAVSHIAGDGKLGGVIEPNDATCHMENHTYTHGLVYDYPSASQINYVARQNNINIIFAIVLKKESSESVRKNLENFYLAMSDVIENSKTGTLSEDSKNVVRFISDIYDQIRESVRITSDANKKEVDVNITARCSNPLQGGCKNIELGQVVDFTATIEPLTCHKDAKLNTKVIKIKPEGLEDQLIVELEVTCDCGCASEEKRTSSAAECNNHGDLECGICRCNSGRFGANCQCNWNESKGEDPSLCIKPGGKNETCSGQGQCKCGKCECKERPNKELIYGKYCECDNFSCPQKCSGKGSCDCGVCQCNPGWIGEGCDCSTDQSLCMAPGSTELCSGRGKCKCGQCQCSFDGEKRYTGKFCERCTNCPEQRCDEFKSCVECQAYQTGLYSNADDCAVNCTAFTTMLVKRLNDTVVDGAKRCRVVVEGDCTMVFEYNYDSNENLVVVAEETKICPYLPPVLVYILGVIGSVLLAGILSLIIWKIVTTIHDKSEYARFLNEKDKTKWSTGENPLYKPGTSHFQNPVYNRASYRASVAPQDVTEKVK